LPDGSLLVLYSLVQLNLKECFSDAEIVELIAFCSFISASQRFGAVLGLQESKHYERTNI
jgi:alkylhydroperoxidase family enzyme